MNLRVATSLANVLIRRDAVPSASVLSAPRTEFTDSGRPMGILLSYSGRGEQWVEVTHNGVTTQHNLPRRHFSLGANPYGVCPAALSCMIMKGIASAEKEKAERPPIVCSFLDMSSAKITAAGGDFYKEVTAAIVEKASVPKRPEILYSGYRSLDLAQGDVFRGRPGVGVYLTRSKSLARTYAGGESVVLEFAFKEGQTNRFPVNKYGHISVPAGGKGVVIGVLSGGTGRPAASQYSTHFCD